MKKILIIASTTTLLSLAYASEHDDRPAPYRPLKGEYSIYSGELGDQQAPDRQDRKLSIIVEGPSAKDIFDAMPPDDKRTCSSEKVARSRTEGNLWCNYNHEDGYACYLGFDLRTGKSIAGGTC